MRNNEVDTNARLRTASERPHRNLVAEEPEDDGSALSLGRHPYQRGVYFQPCGGGRRIFRKRIGAE